MVNIPQGGTIRNSIQWESYYSGGGTWYLHTLYGKKVSGVFNIYWSSSIGYLNHPAGTYTPNIDITIPIDAVLGTYDAWTVISTTNDPLEINTTNIIAEKYDVGVLVIIAGVFAKIISTSFSKI